MKSVLIYLEDDLYTAFYDAIRKKNGREIRRGDVRNAGEEAVKMWLNSQ